MTEPREVDVPSELREALDRDAEVLTAFRRLPGSHRREYAEWVDEAKREETRRRRAERAVAMLRADEPSGGGRP